MMNTVYIVLLSVLTCWEIWLCYRLMYETVLEKKYLTKWNYAVIYLSIFLLGILLGWNRFILFFSLPASYTIIVLVVLCSWMIQRNQLVLKFEIAFAYFVLVAVLDYILAFLSTVWCEEEFGEKIYFDSSFQQIALFFCTRLLVAIIVEKIRKWRKTSDIEIRDFRKILIAVVFIGSIILYVYQFGLQMIALGISKYKGSIWLLSLVCILFILVIVAWLFVKERLIRQENLYLHQKEQMLHSYYQELMNSQQRNRELLHDMKNHLLILKEYQAQGNLQGIGTYLDELSEELKNGKTEVWTGNQVTDIVLNQKIGIAKEKNIRMDIKTETVEQWILSDRESCSLFGNLLDNAIEACEKLEDDRWIEVNIRGQQTILFLEISNSIKEKPVIERGHFLTHKKEAEHHGLGLESVKRIVERYDGDIAYQMDHKKFCVKIAMYGEEKIFDY